MGGPLVVAGACADVLGIVDARLLTKSEQRRSAALHHPADRDDYIAAHLLVRWCAAELTGQTPESLEVVQRCLLCGSGLHGRPSLVGLPGVHVSLAHTRGVVVAAAGWAPVGVDVERVSTDGVEMGEGSLRLIPEVLTPAEVSLTQKATNVHVAFLRHWVRKECLVKMGVATLDTMRAIDLSSVTEKVVDGPRTVCMYGPLHLVDWFDASLGAVIAAAGYDPPLVRGLPIGDCT